MSKQKKRTLELLGCTLFRRGLLVVLLAVLLGAGLWTPSRATAATSSFLNFQARLLTASGSVVPDGNYNIEFKLYDTPTTGGTSQGSCSGNCKWMETRTGGDQVRVVHGYLTVNLGSVTGFGSTIKWDQKLWLTMNVGGTGSPVWDNEMSPRLELTAVPYAFRAAKLASLAGSFTGVLEFASSFGQDSVITLPDPGGATATVCYQSSASCGFLTGSASSYIQNTTSQQSSSNFYISGDGKATGSLQSALLDSISGALAIGTNNATAINLNQNTNILGGKNLSLLSGTGTFSQVFTGTTADATTITAGSLSTGSALKVISSNNSGANNAWSGTVINATNAQASTAVTSGTIAGLSVQLTQGTSVAGNTETVANFTVAQNDTSTADSTVSSIINVANNDTITGNQIGVTDGIKVNGANVVNGINLAGTFGSNLITTTAGTGGFSVSASGALTSVGVNANGGLIQGAGGLTITGAAVSLNAASNFNTDINTSTSTGTVSIGGGNAPFQLNSTALDISNLGVISGATGITSSGAINFSGLTTNGVVYTSGGTGTLNSEANLSVVRGGTGFGSTTAYGLLAGGTTSTGAFQNVGTGSSGQILQSNGSSALPSWVSTGSTLCSDCIIQDPATTARNTIAPSSPNVVALTVKGTTGTAANVLEVFDSTASPVRQAFFDATGSLNVGQTIQPTANNTIDLGLTGTRFRTGYFGTSVSSPVYTGAGAVTLSSAAGNNLTIDEAAAGTAAINIGTTNATSVSIGRTGQGTTVNGTLTATQLLTASASASITGTLTVTASNTSGNSVSISNTAFNTTGANLANLSFTNANTGVTSTTVSGLSITPTGSTNSNPSANKLNAINLPSVTPVTNNAFYALNIGTGYDDLLRYNNTPLISGTGFVQNAAIDSSVSYTNIQRVGALVGGSIISGFGTITTANTITGTTLNGTTGINTGSGAGTQRIENDGDLVNIGNITGTAAMILSTPGGSSNTIALQPGAGASLQATVTKNAATGDETAFDLSATINKATSGNYTGFKLNVTEASAPGSADLLMDLQVATVSKFSVSNAGAVTASGLIQGAAGLTITTGSVRFGALSDGPVYASAGNGTLASETNLSVVRGGTGFGSTTAYGLLAGGTTSTGAFQNVGTGSSGQILQSNGNAALPSWINPTSAACSDCIIQAPTTTARNTIAPSSPNVVALTVKGTTGTAANVLEVFDSTGSPTRQAFFNSTGSLNVSQLIQPTANNTVDLGVNGTAFRTGYFGTSLVSPALTTNGATALGIDTGGAAAINIGATNANAIVLGKTGSNISTTIRGTAVVQPSTGNDSATAFQVQNAGGSVFVFNVDTISNRVGINTNAATADLSFGTGATRTINVNQATSGNDGNGLTIQAGSGNGTNKNGGNLLIQGGNRTGSGTAGSVIVRPQADVANSFRVQDSAGAIDYINVDTATPTVTIGNGTGNTAVSISCGNGACGFGDNAVAHSTSLGSITGGAGTTVQAGTGGVSILTNTANVLTSGAISIATGPQTGSALSSGAITLQTGNAASGTNTSSGAITIDTGTKNGTGTTGAISIGATNASGLTLGHSGVTTTNGGSLTVQGGALTVGTSGVQGSLILHDGNGETATIRIASTLAANTILALPPTVGVSDTFCLLTLNNCAGAAFTFNTAGDTGTSTVASGQTVTVVGGSGLSSVDDGSRNITLSVGAGTGILSNANDVAINQGASLTWTGDETFTGNDTNNLQVNSTITDVTQNAVGISLTHNGSASTGTAYALAVVNADNTSNVGVPDAIGYFQNANAAETVPTGVLVEQTGAGALTNGIEVKRTAGSIVSGLTFTGTMTQEIKLSQSETISNQGNGVIRLASDSGALTLSLFNAGTSATISNNTGDLILDSASNVIQLASTEVTMQRNAAGTYNLDLQDGTGATTFNIHNSNVGQVANLNVEGSISIANANINTAGTLTNVAYLNATSQTFTGVNQFNRNGTGTGDYTFGVTGTTINNATSSLVRIGNAIAGGDATANGGTYLGINSPSSGAGSVADFLNLQSNGTSRLRLTNTGDLTVGGTINTNTFSATALTFSAGATVSSTTGALTLDSGSNTLILAANDTTIQRTASGTFNLDLVDAGGATTFNIQNTNVGQVANLNVEGSISIGGNNINTASTLSNVAYLNATSQNFTGVNQFSRNGTGTGDYSFGVTGTTVSNATSSLVRIGNAIAGGDAGANGGTYLGINTPSSGAGSAADFLNLQANGTSRLRLTNAGNLTVGGTYNTNTFTGSALTFGSASTATISAAAAQQLTVTSAASNSATTGVLALATGDETGSSLSSGAITLKTGDAAGGTNSSSGTITIDSGTKSGSGTTGSISIGTANASALSLGRTGVTTINGGSLTVQGGTLTAGTTAVQGSLVLHDGNGETATVRIGSALVADTILSLPTALSSADTFCFLTLNNCSGTAFTFNTAGDTGTSAVTTGQTVTVAGGSGLASTDNGSRTITLNVGAGTGISVDAANVNVDTAASLTWTGDETFTGNNTNNLQVNSTLTSDVSQNAVGISLTHNGAASTGTVYGLSVINADNTTNVGVPDAVAYFQNANAAETVPAGVLVEQTGAGTLQSGVEIKRTAGTVISGLTFTGAFTREITLRNAETIGNATDGTISLGSDTGALVLNLANAATSATLSNSTGNLIFDSGSNTIQIATTETTLQRQTSGTNTTYTIDLLDSTTTTTLSVANNNGSQVANLSVEGSITAGSTGYFIGGNNINTASTLTNVAYLNATSQNFTGINQFTRNGTGTGDATLAVTGTPINDATSSLIRIGGAIAGGNTTASGGTYLGINQPAAGAGSVADFLNFQANGAVRLRLTSAGVLTLGATPAAGGANSNSICRDSSTGNITACDATNTTGKPFLQGGNAGFGAIGSLGTTDAQSMQFITNNTIRATLDQGDALFLGNGVSAGTPTTAFAIRGTAASNAANNGTDLTLQGGTGNTSGTGGDVTVAGGTGGSTATGGALSLQGGAAGGGNVSGGAVTIQAGAGAGTGVGADVIITAANGGGGNAAGGDITLTSGSATATTTGGIGGVITLQGGNAGGSGNNNGGVVYLLGGTPTGTGTIGNVNLAVNSSNATRGRVNIGINTQGNAAADSPAGSTLVVKDTMEIYNSNPGTVVSQLLFTNTSGTGDFRMGSGGGDLYWQGGGGRALQVGAYWPTLISGDRQTSTPPAFLAGATGTSIYLEAGRTADIAVQVRGFSSGHTGSLLAVQKNSGAAQVLTIAANGATQFKSNAASTTAFVVQDDGSTVNLLQVDNSGNIIYVGATGSDAAASTVNIANTSTNNTQTVSIGSTANASSTVTIQAGTGGSAIQLSAGGGGTINVGNNSAVQSVNLGSANSTSSTLVRAGTGGLLLTSGTNVVVGTSDATGTLLVVDTSTSTGAEPTGVNGAIYYNTGGIGGHNTGAGSSAGKLRCFDSGDWKNCIGMRDIVERRWGYAAPLGVSTATDWSTSGLMSPLIANGNSGNAQAESSYIQTQTGTATNNAASNRTVTSGSNGNSTQTRYLPKLVTRVRTGSVVTSVRYWIAFSNATDGLMDQTNTSNGSHYFGLRFSTSASDTNWMCASNNATTASFTSTGVAVVANHAYDIILEYLDANTLACSVSDVTNGTGFVTVTKTTVLPTNTVSLNLAMSVTTLTNAARALNAAYFFLGQN